MTLRDNIETRSIYLQPGDFVFGVTKPDPQKDEPKMLTGGYKITVPNAPTNAFIYAKIKSIDRKQKFGPHTATANIIKYKSASAVASRTQTGLKYETKNSRWLPANRGPVEHDLLNQIIQTARAVESIDVFIPGYDPRASVATAIDLLLDISQGSTVCLYSPGTSTHWGTKGDIRSEYERYGFSPKMGAVDDAVPLTRIFKHTTISNGTLKDSSPESQLVITKDVDELMDGLQPDYLVVNHLSRAILEPQEKLNKLDSRWPNTPLITLWSTYTKQEYDGVPRYGPPFDQDGMVAPDVEHIPRDVQNHETAESRKSYRASEKTDSLPVPPTTTDFGDLCSDHKLSHERLDASSLTQTLLEAFEEWQNLSDAGSDQGARIVFNALMYFHRLPLPQKYYDDVIQQRAYDGDLYLPKTGDDYLEDIESHSTDGEYSLLHAQKTLEGVQYELHNENPMFERLIEYSKDARNTEQQIAIFVYSKTMVELLRTALCSELSIDELGNWVHVVSPDSARDIPSVDRMVICGPQRPESASFYLHPRAEETVVMTYTDWGERMIERHAKEYADDLDSLLKGAVGISISNDSMDTQTGGSEPEADIDDPDLSEPTETISVEEDNETEADTNTASNDIPDALSDQDINRLRTIMQLQPTKNSELCEQWGYDSGSDLYQYLSSNLNPYYERNDNSLLVLTKKGETVLEALDKTS